MEKPEKSIVRVWGVNDRVVGAGVLATWQHVITCCHVITAALGLPEETPAAPLEKTIWLDFPLAEPMRRLEAQVVAWQPGDDIAVLQILPGQRLPAKARPAKLRQTGNVHNHLLDIFGFPQGYSETGIWNKSIAIRQNARGWLQIDSERQTTRPVAPGFSGGPVWDDQLQGVIGIVVAADSQPGTAFIIPVEKFKQACEPLKIRLVGAWSGVQWLKIFIMIMIIGVGLFVAAARIFPSFASEPLQPSPTPMIPPTLTLTLAPPTAAATLTPVPFTVTPTRTPIPYTATFTLQPEKAIRALIELEGQAAMNQKIELVKTVFAPEAVRVDATGKSMNAIQWYQQNFDPASPERFEFSEITHSDYLFFPGEGGSQQVSLNSCGLIKVSNSKTGFPTFTSFSSLHTDFWTFQFDHGQWQAVNFTLNARPALRDYAFNFEDQNAGCWAVRYYDGFPQGSSPAYTEAIQHSGKGALKFVFNLAENKTKTAQLVIYNLPFQGKVSGYVFLPADAPNNLEAGFFAQELNVEPWGVHDASQMIPLKPGEWTQVTWTVDLSTWKQIQPLHLLGLVVSQKGQNLYQGYIVLDDVVVPTR